MTGTQPGLVPPTLATPLYRDQLFSGEGPRWTRRRRNKVPTTETGGPWRVD